MQKALYFVLLIIATAGPQAKSQESDSLLSRVYSWDSIAKLNKVTTVAQLPTMDGSTASLSRFVVEVVMLAPGLVSPLPKLLTGKEQLVIIKDGKLDIKIKGQGRTLSRGGIAYFMPGEEHSITNSGNTSATFYVFTYQSKQPPGARSANTNAGSFMLDWNEVEFKAHNKGGRKDFFNKQTSQLLKFEMHTTALNAGLDSHPPHVHKEEEIILMLKGNVKVHINGKLYPAAPGDVIFYAAGNPHALLNTGSEQAEYFAFQWSN